MKTRDIMQSVSALQTARPSETLAGVARKMTEHRVSALPVVNDSFRVVGMISERDLLSRAEQSSKTEDLKILKSPLFHSPFALLQEESSTEELSDLAQSFSKVGQTKVEEAMTRDVVLANEEDSVGALVQRMTEHNINHIPIAKDGTLTGLVARQDVLCALSNFARENPKAF